MPRIALTSTVDRSARLADRCARLGLAPVLLPCIDVRPSDGSHLAVVRGEAEGADWIVVTSSRAIDALWPEGGMPDTPVVAVGPTTAEAVRAAGGSTALVGTGGAEELIAGLGDRVRARTVLLAQAAKAGTTALAALQSAGAHVVARAVYEITSIAPGDEVVDAVAFGSPTAVRGWLISRSLEGVLVGAIGPTTAAAVADQSVEVDVVPPQPSFVRLVDSIADCLRDRSPA